MFFLTAEEKTHLVLKTWETNKIKKKQSTQSGHCLLARSEFIYLSGYKKQYHHCVK